MLASLRLTNVGPAAAMKMDLARRLNLITGDNGLGKSFLLDVAWWALTRTWAREMAVPKPATEASIAIEEVHSRPRILPQFSASDFETKYDPATAHWVAESPVQPDPGLVVYVQIDGGFSVWDTMRNRPWWPQSPSEPQRPSAFLFSRQQVWRGTDYCNGLLRDWVLWQSGADPQFQLLKEVLLALSPSPEDPITPGAPRKITVNDPLRYPTLRMPYGEDVPLIHASAGMRRIIALAYLLVWAWQEHLEAAAIRGAEPTPEIVFLVDEVEAHLHPQWQRKILPALLGVMNVLTCDRGLNVQILGTTHAPLVLASMEPHFDSERDRLFQLLLDDGAVRLREAEWALQGDVSHWLVSDTFGLRQARSVEAERVLAAARAWIGGRFNTLPAHLSSQEAIHNELVRVLAGHDPFWPRWMCYCRQEGDSR